VSVGVEEALPAVAQAREAARPMRSPTAWDRAERACDLAIAGALTVVLLPLLLLVVLAIRLDSPGPAIFRQRRVGRHGRRFTVLKFRTMQAGCEADPHRRYVRRLIAADAAQTGAGGLYKLDDDTRVTRVGRWLRRTSVDELPQLVNVLRGDMSLVGPRPVIPYEVDLYPEWYAARFAVKPGLTGLWQVSGRNERTYEEMVRLDVQYARRRSPGLYFGILARTVPTVALRRGVA